MFEINTNKRKKAKTNEKRAKPGNKKRDRLKTVVEGKKRSRKGQHRQSSLNDDRDTFSDDNDEDDDDNDVYDRHNCNNETLSREVEKKKLKTSISTATDLKSAFRSVFSTTRAKSKQVPSSSSSSTSKVTKKQENFEKVGINQLLIKGTNRDKGIETSRNKNLSKLQLKFQRKLEGARFRSLNEQLYSTKGDESFVSFQEDPKLFEVYHEGFREQVRSWPVNPLDMIITWIRRNHANEVVADMGCGDAQLALQLKNVVHSFDLVSVNERVVACDISKLPLEEETVGVVVFCLSLMGTNIGEFLREAHRILRVKGYLKIAEVRSRFEGEKDGIKKFLRTLKKAGFDCTEKNFDNKMFFMIECRKSNRTPIFDIDYSAKVCHYKKR